MGWFGEAGVRHSHKTLQSGKQYDHLFPKPQGQSLEIKPNAEVKHTIALIGQLVMMTLSETAGIARELLVERSLEESCRRLWHFIDDHIRYTRDKSGVEQVRHPARLWWDRKGDCDCMTTFIDSVLMNWKRWGQKLEVVNVVAAYPDDESRYKHIYPVCITPQGRRIVIDCVTHRFDYEEPCLYKAEFPMKLHVLNGFEPQGGESSSGSWNLGKIKAKDKLKKLVSNTGKVIKRGVHTVNRVNPSTLLLRTGLLASMKMNLMNVAGRLKWAYMDEAAAQKRGFDMAKFAKLKKVREKAERIFYSAGGKPENLKEAILKGKGNKGKEISGLGVMPIYAMPGEQSVSEVIGRDLLSRELSMDGLGEPVTLSAAVASAAAVVAALAAELKKIGALGRGDSNSENPDQPGESVPPSELPPDNTIDYRDKEPDQSGENASGDDSPADDAKDSSEEKPQDGEKPKSEGVIGWIKEHPVASGLIGAGIVTGVVLGVKALNKPQPTDKSVAGLKGKKRGRKKKGKPSGFAPIKYVPLK